MNKMIQWMMTAILICGLSWGAVSCTSYVHNPVVVSGEPNEPAATQTLGNTFFSDEINLLIDANYDEVQANGYAKLVIPKSMYKEGLFTFSDNAKSDMDAMVTAGYKVYVNGGTVRDGVMGKEAHDVDFTTDANIEQIQAVLPHAKSLNAFADIWVVKAYHDAGLETDVAPMFSIFPELSGKADVPETKFPGQPYCNDLLEDTYSRDYTFNAMYYDYATGEIIDYHGGLHDLRDGVVRTVFDADLAVSSDPRKVFRTSRFAAKYSFTIDPALDMAFKDHYDVLETLDENNAVYQTESGLNGGFALHFFQLLDYYKVTDFLLTSMSSYLHTADYNKYIEGMLGAFDKEGKADMALCYAAIFWPRFHDEIAGKASVSDADIESILNTIHEGNVSVFRFHNVSYGDYRYVLPFIKDVWSLQLLMTDDANMTDAQVAIIKAKSHYAEAVCFLKARATMDNSLGKYADYWN